MKLALLLSLGFALGQGLGVMVGHRTPKAAFNDWYYSTLGVFVYAFLLYLFAKYQL